MSAAIVGDGLYGDDNPCCVCRPRGVSFFHAGAAVKLHTKIAEEIEHRSANRLTEVAETLAYHYGLSDRSDKAFAYLSMAGSKCLSV